MLQAAEMANENNPPPRYPTDRGAYYAEVIQLRNAIEEKDAEIRYLKDLVAPPGLVFPVRWRLTSCEASLLRALVAAPGIMSKERLLVAMYDFEPSVEIKIVDVFVCKLRKKIGPDGIVIETAWGAGYSIPPPVKAVIREASAAATDGLDWVSPLSAALSPTRRALVELENRMAQRGADAARRQAQPDRASSWATRRQDREVRGNAIAVFRKRHGLTVEKLANLAETKPEYVAIAEQGRGWDKLLAALEAAMLSLYEPPKENPK